MRTNRLISRQDASALELQKRVELEARVTDALGTGIQIPVIPPNWTFRNYSHHRPCRKRMFEFLGSLEGKNLPSG